MFKFLKDKLSKAVGLFSKKVEEESNVKEEVVEKISDESNEQEIKQGSRDVIEESEELDNIMGNESDLSDLKENNESVFDQTQYVDQEEINELTGKTEESTIVELEKAESESFINNENEESVPEFEVGLSIEESMFDDSKSVVEEKPLKLDEPDTEVIVEEESFEQALNEREEQEKLEQKRLEEEKFHFDKQKELAKQRHEEELLKSKQLQEEREKQLQDNKKLLDQKQREEKERKRLEEEKVKKEAEEKIKADIQKKLEAEKLRLKIEQEEKERKKEGFFKKLFSKKHETPKTEDQKPKIEPQSTLVLEKEEFDKVKEDYMLSSETEEELEELAKEKTKEIKAQPEELAKEEKKQGFFDKIKESITTVKLSEEKFDEIFWDLELAMLENNVAVEVIEKIKADLKVELTSGKVTRSTVDEIIHDSLKKSIESLFAEAHGFNLIDKIKEKNEKPYIISFIGVNGAGKTTTMAKVAHLLLKNNLSVVFAASDTFRAAAMAQLQEHADKLGVKMIKHDYESDPAAVAFDAIKHAQAKQIDVVLIDTAGRLHTNDNLMNELKKLIRVNKPDMKIFIGEAITGNDCVEQAKLFNEMVGLDAIILAKADIDEKGGAALSVSYVTKKPILYLGTGQTYDDLEEFDANKIIENIGL